MSATCPVCRNSCVSLRPKQGTTFGDTLKCLVSVLKLLESLESFVIERRQSDSRGLPMWTQKNRPRYDRDHLRYPSDLTDEEWAVIAPLIPPPRPGGGKRRTDMRAVVNGLMYILSTGCQWRYIPKDFPPRSTELLRLVAVRPRARSHSSRALR